MGPNHPSTTSSLNNLAVLYRAMGQHKQAFPLYKQSLSITKAELGPNHPSTATSLNNLAGLYRAIGQHK